MKEVNRLRRTKEEERKMTKEEEEQIKEGMIESYRQANGKEPSKEWVDDCFRTMYKWLVMKL